MNKTFKKVLVCLFALVLLFLVGCGGDDKKDEATLTLEKEEVVLAPQDEYEIIYTVENGNEASTEFLSSNEKVALVDEVGFITARKGGDATITVRVSLEDGQVLEKEIKVKVGFTVTLNPGVGATVETKSVFITSDETYTLPIPTKEHANFLGWKYNAKEDYITELTDIKENRTVTAYWQNEYKVKYELNGGTYESESEYVLEGTKIELGKPTKEGNKFLGWGLSKNSISYVTQLSVNSNVTIYAIWEASRIDVTFECDGGKYTGKRYALFGDTLELGTPHKFGYTFVGWTLEEGSSNYITKLENIKKPTTVYAKWEEGNTNSDFMVTNLPELGIPYTENLQLELAYSTESLKNATVTYTSSDTKVFKVSNSGLIETLKCGIAYLTIQVKGTETLTQEIEIVVYIPGRFDVSYETVSFVEVGENIKLNAKYYDRDENELAVEFKSLDSTVASVTSDGIVTGVSVGTANIEAYVKTNPDLKFDFLVTVLGSNVSDAIKLALNSHESNVFIRYELGIGAGGPAYYKDIIGSVSDLLLTEEYTINRKWEATQAGISSNHAGKKSSTEFICVHYTGNMAKGADANGNASYFASGGGGTSIHYTTGNDGIFHCLDDSLVGFHAGDGTGVKFEWYATGVKVAEGDPQYPVWGISENSKFTINGKETKCDVPEGTTEATKKVTASTFYANGAQQPCINNMGLAFKIVGDEYYMGTTWWCYSQVSSGRICNHGGNNNSIGIESCVNEGSDLWYTWHKTAQLVAHLMVENNLDITRVRGHHFFSAKNCPQPMLENNMEIWYKFIELVEAEYALLTEFKDYKFEYVGLSGIEANNERVSQSGDAKLITYKIKVSKGTTVEEVTLGSVCNGIYGK